ncbi:hypothetical protein BD779DRAFT_434842 [Infundibulicybe gibba]|nr:hypothetical protein BD779DRAFT_434842 [Infundibulicybe gibba]
MTLVHLIYIHGFQGNDTTFQSFPTDLQQYLSTHVPPHLDVKIQSSLYPTYKSVKPISFATKNFLEWLSTQPPGPVILLGHSMGGLLAADAATHISNNPDHYPGAKPRRIIGMIAFDTPYLGMHPHVVITGIASLLPKGENGGKSETDMNDESKVHIVDDKVTDDWDAFKRDHKGHSPRPQSINSSSSLHVDARSPSPASPSASGSHSSPPPLPPRPPRPRSAGPPAGLQPHSPPLIDKAMSFISAHSNDGFVRWIRKHADDPLGASQRWVVERYQFGICMFDPAGLKDRYSRLVGWNGGEWVNYWTQTVPKMPPMKAGSPTERETELEHIADNDVALLETGISNPTDALQTEENTTLSASSTGSVDEPVVLGPPTKSEAKAALKSEQKALKEKRRSNTRHRRRKPTDSRKLTRTG